MLLLLQSCNQPSPLQIRHQEFLSFRRELVGAKTFDPLYPYLVNSDAVRIDSWTLERRQASLSQLSEKFLARYPEDLVLVGWDELEARGTLKLQSASVRVQNPKSGFHDVAYARDGEHWKLDLREFLPELEGEETSFAEVEWRRKKAPHGAYSLECPAEPEVVKSENKVEWKFPRLDNAAFHHSETTGLKLNTKEKQFKYLEKVKKQSGGRKVVHSEFLLDGPKPGVEWHVNIKKGEALAKCRVFLLSENEALLVTGLCVPGTPGEKLVDRYLAGLRFAP